MSTWAHWKEIITQSYTVYNSQLINKIMRESKNSKKQFRNRISLMPLKIENFEAGRTY